MSKLLVKHSLGLPLEEVFIGFISGAMFKPELLQRTLETYALKSDIDYPTEMLAVRKLLSEVVHGVWKNEVYTVQTDEIKPTAIETMLMIRYINICHHCARTIIINDDVVFVPEALQSFPDEEVMAFLKFRLERIGYYTIGEKLMKNPQMVKYEGDEVPKVSRTPIYPTYHQKYVEQTNPSYMTMASSA